MPHPRRANAWLGARFRPLSNPWLERPRQAVGPCGAFVVLIGRGGVRRWVGAAWVVEPARGGSYHGRPYRSVGITVAAEDQLTPPTESEAALRLRQAPPRLPDAERASPSVGAAALTHDRPRGWLATTLLQRVLVFKCRRRDAPRAVWDRDRRPAGEGREHRGSSRRRGSVHALTTPLARLRQRAASAPAARSDRDHPQRGCGPTSPPTLLMDSVLTVEKLARHLKAGPSILSRYRLRAVRESAVRARLRERDSEEKSRLCP